MLKHFIYITLYDVVICYRLEQNSGSFLLNVPNICNFSTDSRHWILRIHLLPRFLHNFTSQHGFKALCTQCYRIPAFDSLTQKQFSLPTVCLKQCCFCYHSFFSAAFASSFSCSAVTPIPAIIEPTTQLCAITRNLIRYLLVVIAGPLFLYAIAPHTQAATVPAIPAIKQETDWFISL